MHNVNNILAREKRPGRESDRARRSRNRFKQPGRPGTSKEEAYPGPKNIGSCVAYDNRGILIATGRRDFNGVRCIWLNEKRKLEGHLSKSAELERLADARGGLRQNVHACGQSGHERD